ncbi:hypothetical protein [Natroniella sp. ANB-PHB2]|uniref:hypothetical protein n=1 Tax=Natroniella sp. ANB-PHB2 TaxID=3384444 RepID=UPI0038D485D9
MAIPEKIYNQAMKCDYQKWQLCNDGPRANCNIPRCCGVCPKNIDCGNLCLVLKEKFDFK